MESHGLYNKLESLSWYDNDSDDERDRKVKDIIRPAVERKNDDAPSIENAARSLDGYISQGAEDAYDCLDDLEARFIEISTVLPYDSPSQDRFVELIATLRRMPHWKGFIQPQELLEASEGKSTMRD